jgi:N-acyl-D-aspartate/D-glutamate deacylase
MSFDLIVRGGRVVDGSGFPSYLGDVGVRDGRIVEVGRIRAPALRILDAHGLVVAPGFIDHHTHYDAQLLWDPLGTSSCWHGVTTVITGNCSLSLAPCKPEDRDGIVGIFVRVEAIARRALEAGVDWSWRSFGDYLDRLERARGINVAAYVGHSAIRQYVMGDASSDRAATEEEIAEMRRLVAEALTAGAVGCSVSRSKHHFREDGRLIPASLATREEILAIASVLADVNAGILHVNGGSLGQEFAIDEAFEFFTDLARVSGRPVLFNQILQRPDDDTWRESVARLRQVVAEGHRVYGTSNALPIRQTYTLANLQGRLQGFPAWRELLFAPPEARFAAFRDPSRRPALREGAGAVLARYTIGKTFQPEHQRWEKRSIGELAAALGKHPVDALLDLAIADDFRTEIQTTVANGDPDELAEILREPSLLIGVSDGGAHTAFAADYGYCTELVGPWVRERGLMSLEAAVSRLTLYPAAVFGLHDRGQVRHGFAADLVLFDPATVGPGDPELVHDYPAGEGRLAQPAHGVHATVVNGEVLIEDGRHTGALPGRVLRGART